MLKLVLDILQRHECCRIHASFFWTTLEMRLPTWLLYVSIEQYRHRGIMIDQGYSCACTKVIGDCAKCESMARRWLHAVLYANIYKSSGHRRYTRDLSVVLCNCPSFHPISRNPNSTRYMSVCLAGVPCFPSKSRMDSAMCSLYLIRMYQSDLYRIELGLMAACDEFSYQLRVARPHL